MGVSRICLVAGVCEGRQEIDLADVCGIVRWLDRTSAYVILAVDGHAKVHVNGRVNNGLIDNDRREFRVSVGNTEFALPLDSFVSGSIESEMADLVFRSARLTVLTLMAGDAWRHVQISRRWVAEQPDNPDSPFGPGELRRLN
jgi:hypothetical protein